MDFSDAFANRSARAERFFTGKIELDWH